MLLILQLLLHARVFNEVRCNETWVIDNWCSEMQGISALRCQWINSCREIGLLIQSTREIRNDGQAQTLAPFNDPYILIREIRMKSDEQKKNDLISIYVTTRERG